MNVRLSNCPECDSPLYHGATSCKCGWGKPKRGEAPQRAQGVENCAWIGDNGERCHYPGTVWRNTHGVGPGFCRFHVQEDCTAAYGAAIVIESRNYKPRTMAQRDHDAVFGERTGPRACQERTCPITMRALPGKDFCKKHQEQFERDPASVRRVGLPGRKPPEPFKRLGEMGPSPRPREPGDDDEDIPIKQRVYSRIEKNQGGMPERAPGATA